jgi:predicted GNAT family acetyltransferase
MPTVCRYKTIDCSDHSMQITHTVVPAAARGLGTAKKLSDAAFAFARSVGASVRPSCTYIKDTYLAKNADGKSFTFNERENLVRLH